MIRLRTLGSIDLRDAGGREIRSLLAQPKRVALLVYLALAGPFGYRRRDRVVALFWPELDDEHARGALRQALTFLRRSLGDGAIITRGEDEIGVDSSLVNCDALALGDDASDEGVMAAYQGDFLDGFHVSDGHPELQTWIEEERLRFRRRAALAAWSLAERRRASGDSREAIALARRAATLMPDSEADTRRLIAWLDELGDRAGAIAVYEEFASRLDRDFEARPSPETQALIGRVRSRTHPTDDIPEPVSSSSTASRPQPAPTVPVLATGAGRSPHTRGSRRLLLAGGMFAIALVMIVLVARVIISPPVTGLSGTINPVTVAVLPLRDFGPDTSLRYIADGLTDELITGLAQGTTMRVISSRTMLAYRSSTLTPDAVARRLNAEVLVSGNVQHIADTVHLTIQLTRAGEATALFARSFRGTRGELLGMQRDIARTLVRQIEGGPIASYEVVGRPPTSSREAVDLYMMGRHYWNKRGADNLLRSITLFTQALDADPLFAHAHSGKADAYVQLGYGSLLPPSDAFPKAEAAARLALQLDSTLAEPHAALGFVNLYYKWDWSAAEAEFKKSIALNPSYATGHEWYGLFLAAMGRFDEALRSERRAMDLDPLSAPVAGTAAWVQYYAGRSRDARRDIGVALRMDSAFALGHFYLSRILQDQGHLDSALTEVAATGALRNWIPTMAVEAHLQAQMGRRREAEATMTRMTSAAGVRYVTPYAIALVEAALGRHHDAFASLRRALADRTHWLVWLNRDPRWIPLRRDPRFAELVRSVGLPP